MRRYRGDVRKAAYRTTSRAGVAAMSGKVIVGDIGGTHARLATADASLTLTDARDYASVEFDDAVQLIERYLHDVQPSGLSGCCLAVAGPVVDGRGKLTNGRVACDVRDIAAALGGKRSILINDFMAVGQALPVLPATALKTIGP